MSLIELEEIEWARHLGEPRMPHGPVAMLEAHQWMLQLPPERGKYASDFAYAWAQQLKSILHDLGMR